MPTQIPHLRPHSQWPPTLPKCGSNYFSFFFFFLFFFSRLPLSPILGMTSAPTPASRNPSTAHPHRTAPRPPQAHRCAGRVDPPRPRPRHPAHPQPRPGLAVRSRPPLSSQGHLSAARQAAAPSTRVLPPRGCQIHRAEFANSQHKTCSN